MTLKKNDSNQVGVPDVPGYQKTRGSTTASWPLNCKGPSDSMCLPPGLADRLTRRSQYRQHPVLCWHLLAHRTAWTVDLRASHLAIADCWFNSKVNNVWKANRVQFKIDIDRPGVATHHWDWQPSPCRGSEPSLQRSPDERSDREQLQRTQADEPWSHQAGRAGRAVRTHHGSFVLELQYICVT